MRGLSTALLAFDFPGRGNAVGGGRERALLSSTKTTAKKTTATTV